MQGRKRRAAAGGPGQVRAPAGSGGRVRRGGAGALLAGGNSGDGLLKRFRGELRSETGDVQFWPHGLDLALLWFSGRLIPGKDPNSPRDADEQMNFGFSTGDGGIPEPYFYVTAYPQPPALPSIPLPDGVVWHNQGWQGAVMRYATLVDDSNAEERLMNYWRTVQKAGMELMR